MIPFFSVVIPTFNSADFLRRSLNSVLSQTFQNIEVIVVNNSSTDHTEDVLDEFQSSRLKRLNVNNRGIIAHSRNKGIEDSTGQWIAFLDSDDTWNEGKLEIVHACIQKHPNHILFCHDEWEILNGKRMKRLRYGPASKNQYETLLFKGNCLSTSATCIRHDTAVETNGFSEAEEFVTAEDYEYWIRLAQVGCFYFLKEALGEYHRHRNNASSDIDKQVQASMAVREYHFQNWIAAFPNKISRIRQARVKMWTSSAHHYGKNQHRKKALYYVTKVLRHSQFYWKAWVILFLLLIRRR